MARPEKPSLNYYPRDLDMLRDRKIRRLMAVHGLAGLVVYDYLLCLIYGDKGYYMVYDADLAFDIADFIRNGLNEETVKKIIGSCVQFDLFYEPLFRQNILTSFGIQTRYLKAKKNAQILAKFRVKQELTGVNSEETPVNSDKPIVTTGISTQSKVKKSKVKKSKVEEADSVSSPLAAAPAKKDFKTPVLDFPAKEKNDPPPSSAAPPSLVRDENGVATCQELRKSLLEYQEKNPELYKNSLYREFLKYWSEPNERNVPRWKTEKTKKGGRFDIAGRLSTWYSKSLENGSNRNTTYRGSGSSLRPMGQAEPEYRGGRPLPEIEL